MSLEATDKYPELADEFSVQRIRRRYQYVMEEKVAQIGQPAKTPKKHTKPDVKSQSEEVVKEIASGNVSDDDVKAVKASRHPVASGLSPPRRAPVGLSLWS